MSETAPRHPFDTDTRTERIGPEEYAGTVTDRWNTLLGTPNGGYLAALALDALGREVPFPDPLAVSAFFLRPAAPGPALVRTETARKGRRTGTGEARLFQQDREIVRLVATFSDLAAAQGRTLRLAEPPDLPAPETCLDPLDGLDLPDLTLAERVEYRSPRPPGFLSGSPGGDPTLEFWMRFRGGRPHGTSSLPFLVDAAAPAVIEVGEFASATAELTVHIRARPAPGWLACRAATRHISGGFHEEDMEIWDSTGTLVAQSRQLAVLG